MAAQYSRALSRSVTRRGTEAWAGVPYPLYRPPGYFTASGCTSGAALAKAGSDSRCAWIERRVG